MTSSTVLADAQFGTARILRPYDGFEAVYQGQPASTPIMLSEVVDPPGGDPLDPSAATRDAGYSSRLVRGLDVPMGSRVLVWLPQISAIVAAPSTIARYQWTFIWRLRNVYDYRNSRTPYHFPKQAAGVPETGGDAGPRVIIPAATQTLPYSQSPEPAGNSGVLTNLRNEAVTTGASVIAAPLLPGGTTGIIQQGLGDPNIFPAIGRPIYQLHEVQACGDELLIGLTRATDVTPNWDFNTPLLQDWQVRLYLGDPSSFPPARQIPDVGVYVMTGSAP